VRMSSSGLTERAVPSRLALAYGTVALFISRGSITRGAPERHLRPRATMRTYSVMLPSIIVHTRTLRTVFKRDRCASTIACRSHHRLRICPAPWRHLAAQRILTRLAPECTVDAHQPERSQSQIEHSKCTDFPNPVHSISQSFPLQSEATAGIPRTVGRVVNINTVR
jgi:hypothetical protein